jgi:hypothetical protein
MPDHGQADDSSGHTQQTVNPSGSLPRSGANQWVSNADERDRTACNYKDDAPKFFRIAVDRWLELVLIVVIAGATVVNVCVANRQWSAMRVSNRINTDAMIAANRASIAPIRVELNGRVTQGQKIKYTLYYQNTGHSPAERTTFVDDQSDSTLVPAQEYILAPDPKSPGWIDNKTCDPAIERQKIHNWPATYPFGQPTYTIDFESDAPASEDIAKGRRAHITKGCFVYNTLTLKQRVSQWCFYLEPKDWTFRRCAYGNDAN